MAVSDADASLNDTAHAAGAGVTRYNRFYLYLSPDFDMSNGDYFDLLTLRASGSVSEGQVTIARQDPDGIVLAARNAGDTGPWPYIPLHRGMWQCIETMYTVDSGGGNDGVLQVWANGATLRVTNMDQGAIVDAAYGVKNQTGALAGHMYLDAITLDDARLYPLEGPPDASNMAGQTMLLTKSGWVFVGSGEVVKVTAIDASAGDTKVKVYDTNKLNYAEHQKVAQVSALTAGISQTLDVPFKVMNGCYVKLEGTNPQAIVQVGGAHDPGLVGYDPGYEMDHFTSTLADE